MGWRRTDGERVVVSPEWGIRALGLAKIAACSVKSQPGVMKVEVWADPRAEEKAQAPARIGGTGTES